MEINIRLNSKDVNSDGVFTALENLYKCFKPCEGDCGLTIHPAQEQKTPDSIGPAHVGNQFGTDSAHNDKVNTVNIDTPAAKIPCTPTAPTVVVPTVPTAPTPTVPTAAPQYTLEMIAKAGTALVDAGKMNEVTALLAKYGVEVLTALDPAHYGTFAAELRAMGASI